MREREVMPVLRALIVEDSENDAALLRRELGRAYELASTRVQTTEEMNAAISSQEWDIVFSDWHLPTFSAPEAMEVVRRSGIDVPLIIVSGTIGEDAVVEALRSGARDFFVKGKLTLLQHAIARELREAEARRERARMQEQLMISDRMASVGVLAAGVAHEINNPLGAVVGNIVLARQALAALPLAESAREQMREILDELRDAHDAAQRIRDVASDLKLFARSEADEQGAVDVQQVVESSLRMARTEIRHRARLSTSFKPVPMVLANASRLGQVFLNLVVNAAQAIPEGRTDTNEIAIATFAEGDRVVVEVRDTGSGMTAEVRERLFSPFFTTKPAGVGTGLGLSICDRIVRSFGGTISVESEVGVGSTFRVELVAAAEVDAEPVVVTVDQSRAVRRGSVLVIDDEPAIGILVERVLGGEHDVRRTVDADEALDWIADGARFDVIFCDLMMPHVTGVEFYQRLAARDAAHARAVVFITGGTFRSAAREFVEALENPVLEKPFELGALRVMVNERL
jgi:signal transduction histidine kinase